MSTSPHSEAISIAGNVRRVRERIEAACARSGRPPDSVTLIGIAKTFPVGTVRDALDAGLVDIGENRVQELIEKATLLEEECRDQVRWHFVGHLQRNKVRHLLAHDIAVIHSVDSIRLAHAIARVSQKNGRTTTCLVQVNTSVEKTKHGLPAEALRPFLSEMAGAEGLRIRGLMTIPAPTPNPENVRTDFALLRELAEKHADIVPLDLLSMGMSGDFEVAIEEGATHVRVGTAVFGLRDTCRID